MRRRQGERRGKRERHLARIVRCTTSYGMEEAAMERPWQQLGQKRQHVERCIKSKKGTAQMEWKCISAIGKDHQQQKHWQPQQQSSRDAAAAAAERAGAAVKDRVEKYTTHLDDGERGCMQVNGTTNMVRPIRLVHIEKGPKAMKPDVQLLQLIAGDGGDPGPIALGITQ